MINEAMEDSILWRKQSRMPRKESEFEDLMIFQTEIVLKSDIYVLNFRIEILLNI